MPEHVDGEAEQDAAALHFKGGVTRTSSARAA
jgi:hypothetical protein